MIQIKRAIVTRLTLVPMARIDWVYVLSVSTLALSVGAMCILLFAL